MVEATRDLARQLDVHHLVLANRHQAGPINQDVSRLQERIAEETVGREILFLQSFLLILVGRHPLQPTEWGDHRQQEVQFGVFGHAGLDKQGRLARVDTGSQPVDDHVPGTLRDHARIVVVRGQRVPVGDEKETLVLVLQLDPVFQNAMVVPEVQASCRAHAGQYAGMLCSNSGQENLLGKQARKYTQHQVRTGH